MLLLVHAFPQCLDVPIATNWAAEENIAQYAPCCGTKYKDNENITDPPHVRNKGKKSNVLQYEGSFDEIACKMIEDSLGEYKLWTVSIAHSFAGNICS